ncbi:MAG: class I SAM-dependent methyltransferase [Verrucomicrobiota bacterium]
MSNQAGVKMLSPSVEVSMGEQWFLIASQNHFWIKRRFEIFAKLSQDWLSPEHRILDVGCGRCLFSEMLAERCDCPVDGADLNLEALNHAGLRVRNRFCYDINQRNADMRDQYDLVTLFDVIEHIDDDASFVESAMWHLKPEGFIVINVPALEYWRSAYDNAVGHKRRYNFSSLSDVLLNLGLSIHSWSYWAAPLIPFVMVRKMLIKDMKREDIIERGFRPPSEFFNWGLGLWSGIEYIPNHLIGASLMVVAVKGRKG